MHIKNQKIALGTVQFGIDYGVSSASGKVSLTEAKKILDYGIKNGIELLDTAPSYGDSEKVLGKIGVNSFNLVSKTRHFSNTVIKDDDAYLLKQDFSKSLEKLKLDNMYGLLVHNANDLLKPGSHKIFNQLLQLREEKKIKKIGVSVYDSEQIQSIIDNFDIDLIQLPFNILDSRLINNNILNILNNESIEIHVRSVFLQGLLLMSEQDRPGKFKRWSGIWNIWHQWLNDNNITALEACLRYAVSFQEISKVLIGVDTKHQLKEIINSADGHIPDIPLELFINDSNLLNPSNWEKL